MTSDQGDAVLSGAPALSRNVCIDSTKPRATLTILVATYNRAVFLEDCLAQIVAQIEAMPARHVNVVVSDNCSTDHTQAVAERFAARHSFLTYLQTDRHYHSAEENFFWGLKRCEGEYLWPFGDDDFLAVGAIERVMALIADRTHSFILINSRHIGADGRILSERLVPMSVPSMTMTMVQMAQLVGITTILASFTSSIMHRAPLAAVDLDRLVEISPIYAHVAAYLTAYGKSDCLLLNEQLVTLRAGTGLAAFETFASRTGRPLFAPWTIGLLRLMDHVSCGKHVPIGFIFHTLECDATQRFWTWCRILSQYTRQIELAFDVVEGLDAITMADFNEFRSYMTGGGSEAVEIFALLAGVVERIALLHELRAIVAGDQHPDVRLPLHLLSSETKELMLTSLRDSMRDAIVTAQERIHAKMCALDLRGCAVIGDRGGYNIYQATMWYVAARRPVDLVGYAIGVADLTSHWPLVIVARDVSGLEEEIDREASDVAADVLAYKSPPRLVEADGVATAIRDAVDPRQTTMPSGGKIKSFFGRRGETVEKRITALFDPVWYAGEHLGSPSHSHEALDHYARVGCARHLSPSAFFLEEWYIGRYPDVRAMLRKGRFVSGLHHFLREGRTNGFDPHPMFRSHYYAARYPEAAHAVAAGQNGSVYEYFLAHGLTARHRPHPDFDEYRYLAINLDVADAVTKGDMISGWWHYVHYGRKEGRAIR